MTSRMQKLLFLLGVLVVALLAPGAAFGAGMIGFSGMIIDAELRYSVAQSLAASAASTNIIDHGTTRNLGDGEPMAVVIVVTTVLDGGNADETYAAQLQTDDNSGFGSPTSVGPSYSLPRSSAAGTTFICPIPPGVTVERYTRLNYTVAGTTPSGNVNAFLTRLSMVSRLPGPVVYPDAITISS